MADRMDVSDKTAISMPMRNLLSILAAVGIGVYAFSEYKNGLTMLRRETRLWKPTSLRIQNLE